MYVWLLEALMTSPYALPATALAAILLVYLTFVTACAVGRIRLVLRPADAPLITDDGPAIGERVEAEVMNELVRHITPGIGWGNGRRVAVVFATPACAPCQDLLPHLVPAARRWKADTHVLVVLETSEISESHPALEAWNRLPLPVLRDPDGELTANLAVRNRPFALLLDPLGVVLMKGVVSTGGHLDALAQEWGVPAGKRDWRVLDGDGVASKVRRKRLPKPAFNGA